MVWGGICARGKTRLYFLEGNIDSNQYKRQVLMKLKADVVRLYGRPENLDFDCETEFWILQQDGATCHTSNATKAYLNAREWVPCFMGYQDWPSNSPDMSPIELVWAVMDDRVAEKNPQTIQDLKDAIQEIWDALSQREINNLLAGVTRRCERLLRNGGEQL